MITLPLNNRRWSQTNSGEVFGDLYSSYNINFDEEGYLSISPKSVSLYSTADDSDFDLPVSIQFFDGEYFIVTSDGVFSLGANVAMTEIGSSPATTKGSDAVVFNNKLYITSDTNLSSLTTTGTWANSLESLTTGKAHPLAVMGNFSGGQLAIGNGNKVLLIDTSDALSVTLTLNDGYEVTSLEYRSNVLYVATKCTNGGEAKMFLWNGSGTSAQQEYGCASNWIFSVKEYNSSLVIVTNNGQLLRFNGGGFDVLANFPVYYSQYRWTNVVTSLVGKVLNRGMIADGDVLYINIDGTVAKQFTLSDITYNNSFYLPNQPSGVWCFDQEIGLYCRHLSTTDGIASIAVSSMSANVLTLASLTRAVTGEPIYITNVGSLTGIIANRTYYVIYVTSTTIKLALTPADALAGTAITLGGTAGAATVKVIKYLEYGLRVVIGGEPGAISLIQPDNNADPAVFPEIFRTSILWGFGTTGTTVWHLNCLSTARNIGGFVTSKIWSSQIKDTFQKLFIKYNGIHFDEDKIIIKKRTGETFGLPTVVEAGTFSNDTTLGSASDYLEQAEVGHSINLLTGNGAGQSLKITSITGDEYMFSEALPNVVASDTSVFTIDNFEKLTNDITEDKSFHESLLGETASWYQFMFELRGKDIKIEELQLVQTVNQKSQ